MSFQDSELFGTGTPEGGDEEETQEELEARAWAMGWRPEDQYRGPPGTHKTAAEFIAHGESQLPILRKQSREMSGRLANQEREIANLRRTVTEQKAAVDAAIDLARKADKRGYDRAVTELDQRMDRAVEAGDSTAARQIQAERDTMVAERAKVDATPAPAPAPAPAGKAPDPDVGAFITANPWFNANPTLRRAMIAHHELVAVENPNLSMVDQLAEARARVMKAFPAQFPGQQADDGNDGGYEEDPPPRRRAASVARPGAATPPNRRGPQGWDRIEDPSLRAQMREACAREKSRDPGLTDAEYIDVFLGENGANDIVAYQAKHRKRN